MLVWHCYPTTTSEPAASKHSASCKNLDLADRSCSTNRFQIVLNDLDVAHFTLSAAKLLTKDEARRIAVNVAKLPDDDLDELAARVPFSVGFRARRARAAR